MTELVVRLSPDDRAVLVAELVDELKRQGLVIANDKGGVATTLGPLLSLDELAAGLAAAMPARSERQWAKYLYEHAPRGSVPEARKVAGRWWFPASTLDALCGGVRLDHHPPGDILSATWGRG